MGLLSKFFSNAQTQPEITITIGGSERSAPAKREFSDNDPALLESIQLTQAAQPTHRLPLCKACPYCGAVFDKPVGRKKTCPHCKHAIYVRTTQDLYPLSALTEQQVADVDFYMALKNILMLTKQDYLEHEDTLKKRWNMPKVNTYDVLWSMYNDLALLQRNIDKSMDKKWASIQVLRNHQTTSIEAARYQTRRGNDPTLYLKTAQNYFLQIAQLEGNARGLTVQASYCCDACTKFHDKTFSLDFIAKNPVLPIKACTNPFEDGSKFVFCTCSYREYYDWQ